MDIIDSLNDINVEWVGKVLSINKKIIHEIKPVEIHGLPVSYAAIVDIKYLLDDNNYPKTIFVKISNKNTRENMPGYGEKEVTFYNSCSTVKHSDNIPRCYYSVYDKYTNIYNVVLEDLSRTHFQTEYPVPPSIEYCKKAVMAFADMHAIWWDHPKLDSIAGRVSTPDEIDEYITYLNILNEQFAKYIGDRLGAKRREILKKVGSKASLVYNVNNRNRTLIHGDAHLWNMFFPKARLKL